MFLVDESSDLPKIRLKREFPNENMFSFLYISSLISEVFLSSLGFLSPTEKEYSVFGVLLDVLFELRFLFLWRSPPKSKLFAGIIQSFKSSISRRLNFSR